MHVHAAARLAEHGLRHEGGVYPVELRDFLHNQPVRHDLVGHLQALVVAEVYLVLARSHLVVAVLDPDPEVLERAYGLLAKVHSQVARRHVEVGAVVKNDGAVVVLQVVVLELRTHEEGEPLLGGARQCSLEHVARVRGVRGPVGVEHVAEHRGHQLALLAPRHDLQR